jgi:hypothetical protein
MPSRHVEVHLELWAAVSHLRVCRVSWDFTDRWFALFAAVVQRLPEQRRNRRPGLDDGDGLVVVVDKPAWLIIGQSLVPS